MVDYSKLSFGELAEIHKKMYPDCHFLIGDKINYIEENHLRTKEWVDYWHGSIKHANQVDTLFTVMDIKYKFFGNNLIQELELDIHTSFKHSDFFKRNRKEKIKITMEKIKK